MPVISPSTEDSWEGVSICTMYLPSPVDCTCEEDDNSELKEHPGSALISTSADSFESKTIGFRGSENVKLGFPT